MYVFKYTYVYNIYIRIYIIELNRHANCLSFYFDQPVKKSLRSEEPVDSNPLPMLTNQSANTEPSAPPSTSSYNNNSHSEKTSSVASNQTQPFSSKDSAPITTAGQSQSTETIRSPYQLLSLIHETKKLILNKFY